MINRKTFDKRLEALRSERSSFIPLYQDLSDYVLSHRGRFLTTDRNKGYRRNTRQYNNTARIAARTLAAGMMSGITSPARPWFKLGASDDKLNEVPAVKQWLHDVQTTMYRVFSRSNTYNSLHMVYGELAVFGTGAMGVFHNFQNVIRCKPYTVGSYMIGADGTGRIDTFYMEHDKTVGQCVKEYGLKNCSQTVQDQWKKGDTESWVTVIIAIEPNDDRDNLSPLASDKAFRSIHYEFGSGRQSEDKFLKRSGFNDFPIMVPRWDITGEDIYATDSPGMIALGDIKALQLGEKRKYQALDKVSNPQLQGPSSLIKKIKNAGVGNHVATDSPTDQLSSIYGNWRPDLNAMIAINKEVEQRIDIAFFKDLFLMLAQTDRREITAREVAERHEEKLLMLGPVLERLHSELLDPLIDRTFNILNDAGVLPIPPRELQNTELNVEYVSLLAQAQRMVATTGIERLTGFAGNLAQLWPEARHKINVIDAIDEYADSVGVNPRLLRSDEEVKDAQAAENQIQQMQQLGAASQQVADIAKTASEANLEGDNALTNVGAKAGLL